MGTNSKRSVAKSDKSWPGGYWTNERHLQYLNSVEASFVRAMLNVDDHNNNNIIAALGSGGHSPPPPPPRLDRYLPDSSESTLDLKSSSTHHLRPRPRRHSASDILEQRGIRRLVTSQSRINACQDHDQVVPQLEK